MLTDLLRELAIARADLQAAEDETNQLRDTYQEASEFVNYLIADGHLDMIKSTISLLEREVRTEALRAYEQGELPPPPGISIKIYHTVSYDNDEAQEWVREHAPALLTLDDARFKKAVLSNAFTNAPAVVKDEPRAMIASNLSSYLPGHQLGQEQPPTLLPTPPPTVKPAPDPVGG
jgi:hypothetical protein